MNNTSYGLAREQHEDWYGNEIQKNKPIKQPVDKDWPKRFACIFFLSLSISPNCRIWVVLSRCFVTSLHCCRYGQPRNLAPCCSKTAHFWLPFGILKSVSVFAQLTLIKLVNPRAIATYCLRYTTAGFDMKCFQAFWVPQPFWNDVFLVVVFFCLLIVQGM